MRENNENWRKQLDTVTLEIVGLNEIFLSCPLFLQLLSKLEGLQVAEELDFDLSDINLGQLENVINLLNIK